MFLTKDRASVNTVEEQRTPRRTRTGSGVSGASVPPSEHRPECLSCLWQSRPPTQEPQQGSPGSAVPRGRVVGVQEGPGRGERWGGHRVLGLTGQNVFRAGLVPQRRRPLLSPDPHLLTPRSSGAGTELCRPKAVTSINPSPACSSRVITGS